MIRDLAICLSILLSGVLTAQPALAWKKADAQPYITGPNAYGWLEFTDLKLDDQGNIFLLGNYTNMVDFDCSSSTHTMSTLTSSNGGSQPFLLQLDAAGNFVWVKQLGEIAYYKPARRLQIDKSGNFLISGGFIGLSDFDPGPSSYSMVPSAHHACYIQKLDHNGNFIWAKQIDVSSGESIWDFDLALGPQNQIALAGLFTGGVVDLDPGPGIAAWSATSNANYFGFVTVLDSAGGFKWGHALTDHDSGIATAEFDATGNLYCGGRLTGVCDFDPGPAAALNSTACAFVAKYSPGGSLVYAEFFDGAGTVAALDVDQSGNIYAAGNFGWASQADLDPGSGVHTVTPNTQNDAFIVKLGASANFLWADHLHNAGGSWNGSLFVQEMILDSNSLLLHFSLTGSIDVDPGSGLHLLSSHNTQFGWSDIAMAEFNTNGALSWAYSIGPCANNNACYARDMAGNIFLAGFHTNDVDLDPDTTVQYTGFKQGYFVKKLSDCRTPSLTLLSSPNPPPVCGLSGATLIATGTGTVQWFLSPAGGTPVGTGSVFVTPTLSANTTFYAGVQSCAPGSSRIPVPLSVLPAFSIQAIADKTTLCEGQSAVLMAFGANAYTWSQNLPPLQVVSVAPVTTTTYVVTGHAANGCKSSVNLVITVQDCTGIHELSANKPLLFPNPASDQFDLILPRDAQIAITDVTGRQLLEFRLKAGANKLQVTGLSDGAYFIVISDGLSSESVRLVIQN